MIVMLATLLVSPTASCSSARELAEQRVADDVRRSVFATRDLLLERVSAEGAPRGRALLDRTLDAWPTGADVLVFSSGTTPDGGVAIGTAFHSFTEMSTGFSGDRIVGRICVEHRATPGPPPTVDVVEVECPATLPTYTRNAGNVDFIVRLDP